MINNNSSKPLYEQIEEEIKNKILSGELKKGDRVGSHNELSSQYEVSVITVKKALNNLINNGYLYTRVGKGTYVAEPREESGRKFGEHKTIGLVLNNVNHPYFSMIMQSIEERAYELNYTLLLSNSSNKIEKEESQINHFREIGVDGMIIASLSLQYRATPYIQKLHDDNFPYIMISYMHDPQYWFIGTDNEKGAYIATEHFIKLGYRKIGYVYLGKNNLLTEVRKNGYARALMDYDYPYNSKRVFSYADEKFDTGQNRIKLGYQFGREFAHMDDRPDALLFYGDTTALGFIKYTVEAGIKVPDDVAVIGYDDIALAGFSPIPLSTVRQPVKKIGRQAVNVIHKRLNNEEVMNRVIYDPELVIRETCGGLRITNKAANLSDIAEEVKIKI